MTPLILQRNTALARAMPVTRMVDYGLPQGRAETVHDRAAHGEVWEDILVSIASEARHRRDFRTTAAALNFAQMAENFDTVARQALFRASIADFAVWAEGVGFSQYRLRWKAGELRGWYLPAHRPDAPLVIVIGGMSGWASSFADNALALRERGLACLLLDGPGQGETRIEGGLYLQDGYSDAVRAVVRDLSERGCGPLGIWGNSMGGLFAAVSARDEPALTACCINGAPLVLDFPAYRTAREQMAALFGAPDVAMAETDPDIRGCLRALSFDGRIAPLTCPVLICEGGADPLVAYGSQAEFLTGNEDPLSATFSWPDGEHTLYNHHAERNAKVADWFAKALMP